VKSSIENQFESAPPPRVCCVCRKIVSVERVRFINDQPYCPACHRAATGGEPDGSFDPHDSTFANDFRINGPWRVSAPEESSSGIAVAAPPAPPPPTPAPAASSSDSSAVGKKLTGDSSFHGLSDSDYARLNAPAESFPELAPQLGPAVYARRRKMRRLAQIAVGTGVVGGLLALAVAMFMSSYYSRANKPHAGATTNQINPLVTIETQLHDLMADARRLQAQGALREAAGKYQVVHDFLSDPDTPDPKLKPLLLEAREKLAKLNAGPATPLASASSPRGIFDQGTPVPQDDGALTLSPTAQATAEPGLEIAPPATLTDMLLEDPERALGLDISRLEPQLDLSPTPPPTVASQTPAPPPQLSLEAIPAPADLSSAFVDTDPSKPITFAPVPSGVPSTLIVPVQPDPSAKLSTSPADPQVARGVPLLRFGDLEAADSAFKQAIALDNQNHRGFHGRGLVAMLKNRPDEAINLLEIAYRVAPKQPPPRTLVYNLAAAHLSRNPMRAARYCIIYLSNPKVGADEELANALGAALNMADDWARGNSFYAQARDFYLKYDLRLAAARGDGMQRWGMQWLAAADAAAKWAAYRQNAETVAQLRVRAAHATIARQKVAAEIDHMNRSVIGYSATSYERMNRRYMTAAQRELEVRSALSSAEGLLSSTEIPPLLTALGPILDP
jgi:tetratricopeptide (TPR) repeat protein